jgi:acyl-CoA synthetase (NDP forming)
MADLIRRLERALNPRTVAVVGDKGPGYMWLRSYREFKGKLYSVQVDAAQIPGIEAMGIPNYASLLDIPDELDYVMCAVPRQVAPRITADAAAKKVGAIAFFTSGFAETDEEIGIRLQEQLLQIALENDLLIIGPNCMGLYNPAIGIRQSGGQATGESGPVAFISQSGTHAINFGTTGYANGIRISKSVSMGNAIVLNAAHYIEYLTEDPETKVIAMYMEGVKDGRHLFAALKKATAVKPVVVWKGGQTPAGQRATHSHTASLATPAAIWQAVVRQTGVIPTDSLDETLDVCKALVYAKPTAGNRMALLAMTGGQSVSITDAFAKQGLEVPPLTEASYARLSEFFNIIGGSYRNPFDMAGTIGQRGATSEQDNLREILRIVEADPNIDAIAVDARGPGGGPQPGTPGADQSNRMVEALREVRERSAKPVISIVHPGANEGHAAEGRQQFLNAGIASFHSFERAAVAMAKAISYWRYRSEL